VRVYSAGRGDILYRMRLYKVGMSVFCNSFGARAGRLANSRSLQLFQNLRQQTRGRRNHDLSRGRRRASSRGAMNVFDRTAKRRQKNRAYASPDAQTYDYIRNEVLYIDQKYLRLKVFLPRTRYNRLKIFLPRTKRKKLGE
jgi:hypothetical protein